MVPYFPPLRIHLFGPVYIHAFGVLVAAAVIAGWRLSLARCRRKGLDPDRFRDLLVYVIGTGFVCAHLYSEKPAPPPQGLAEHQFLRRDRGGTAGFLALFPHRGAEGRVRGAAGVHRRHRLGVPVRLGDRAARVHGRA
jgi:hypothetical protein